MKLSRIDHEVAASGFSYGGSVDRSVTRVDMRDAVGPENNECGQLNLTFIVIIESPTNLLPIHRRTVPDISRVKIWGDSIFEVRFF